MSHPIVEKILSDEAPFNIKRAAVSGALPIPREDQLELWACLRNDKDNEIKSVCRQNLASVKTEEWLSILKDYPFRKEFFDFVAKVLVRDEKLALLALRNRSMPASYVEDIAKSAKGSLIDAIIDGQARIVEFPGIAVALLNNPNLTPTQGRRLFDLSEQFFRNHPVIPRLIKEKLGLGIKAEEPKVEIISKISEEVKEEKVEEVEVKEEEKEITKPQVEEKKEEVKEMEKEEATLPKEAFKEELKQEEVKSLYQQILTMSVPKKIELALKGNKEARGLLIRDSNKVVQEAVVTSPKITEQEIEAIANMRSLPEELLRKIAQSKEWMRKHNIVKALASNPKTPFPIALSMLNRLTDFDLKNIMKDRNIPESIRKEAKKIFEVRNTPKTAVIKKH
jgi:hypothetical protein